MTKVLVVGSGHIGQTVATMLASCAGEGRDKPYDVMVVDCNPIALAQIRPLAQQVGCKIATKHMIIEGKDFRDQVSDSDYVVNAGPYFISADVATICGEEGTHYFDLTEDVEQTSKIMELAGQYPNSAFVSQCGLAPGFISILTNDIAKKFDEVVDVKMRVGALPMHPSNELKYNTTWSVDGLINEYLQPCILIRRGEIVEVEALEGYETFNLDGDSYEAFNTSGGLGTLCNTWCGKVHSMNYKTVRYPGHNYLMKFLINDLKLTAKQLKNIIESAIPATNQDVVLIFVEVTGKKGGVFVSETTKKKIYGQHGWSAIQLSTASGICAMLHSHCSRGLQPQTGFIRQEDCSLATFLQSDAELWKIYNCS